MGRSAWNAARARTFRCPGAGAPIVPPAWRFGDIRWSQARGELFRAEGRRDQRGHDFGAMFQPSPDTIEEEHVWSGLRSMNVSMSMAAQPRSRTDGTTQDHLFSGPEC